RGRRGRLYDNLEEDFRAVGRGREACSSPTFRQRLRPKTHPQTSQKTSTSSALASNDKDGYKVVCYYTNWSQYRPKHGKFLPEDIEPDLCTHIIYAFGWLKKGKLSSFESNDETKEGKTGLYERIMTLKKANPKLKILLAIGGWSFGTQKFKVMSATRYARQTFIYSAIPFLRDRNFDGLDMDWEYPKGTDDKRTLFCCSKESVLLYNGGVILFVCRTTRSFRSRSPGTVASYLDFINLMAYDFHGKWERETGHNAPLYAPSSDSEWRKQLSVDHAATMWVKLGAPKDKLVIGMPTYGRTFTLSNTASFKVNSPASGGGKAGDYTKEGGFLAYYEVCEMLRNGASYVWDDEMKVPYAIQGDQWVGFDDERSIRNKMHWIKDNGYAGAMVWTVDMDDFTGTICGGDVKYPLIGVMREELRRIKRSNNAKDIDWSKVANSISIEVTTKPAPIKISVSEVLKRVRPHKQTTNSSALLNVKPDLSYSRGPQVFCYMTSWSQKRPGAGKFTTRERRSSPLYTRYLCICDAQGTQTGPRHTAYNISAISNFTSSVKSSDWLWQTSTPTTTISLLAVQGEFSLYPSYNLNFRAGNRVAVVYTMHVILLAIGGWAFGSTPFKELTSNVFRMNQFVYEAIELLRDYKFNGLDVDWEYPRGADDRLAYVNLLKELRTAFEGEAKSSGEPRLLLTAAVPASFEAIAAG
ncbi:hypothetical protein L9F63_009158, partial [Diploptera punctata]